jgi:hypothetical protein
MVRLSHAVVRAEKVVNEPRKPVVIASLAVTESRGRP